MSGVYEGSRGQLLVGRRGGGVALCLGFVVGCGLGYGSNRRSMLIWLGNCSWMGLDVGRW